MKNEGFLFLFGTQFVSVDPGYGFFFMPGTKDKPHKFVHVIRKKRIDVVTCSADIQSLVKLIEGLSVYSFVKELVFRRTVA